MRGIKMKLEVNVQHPAPASRVVDYARRDNEVTAVALYGTFATGMLSGISDLDICIVLAQRKCNPVELHRKRMEYTEVAGSDEADVQVFQQLPLSIRLSILREGKMVLVKDEEALYDLALETVKDFDDFRRHYNEYLAGMVNA